MSIAAITRLTGVALALIALALALLGYAGIARLEQPYRLSQDYYALKDILHIHVRGLVGAYLGSGDALRLQEADAVLQDLIEEKLPRLPADTAAHIRPAAQALRNGVGSDLLASGKLSGDPQGLLLNAEREFSAAAERLARYAEQGAAAHGAKAFRYQTLSAALQKVLAQGAHARQRLFETGDGKYREALLAAHEEIRRRLAEAQDWPRLGINSAPMVDEDALVKSDAKAAEQDQAEEIR